MSEEKENIASYEIIEKMDIDERNDKLYQQKKRRYILKGLCSLLSCIINQFGYFTIWIMGNSIVYLISFRRYYNKKLTFSYGYFLIPIMDLTLSILAPIGGIIEDKIGGKKTITLSAFILCISFTFMYFSRNILIDYLLMCLNGLGLAIGISISKKNVCSFFLDRKALINGIVYLIPGFLCAGLNIFNEKYILNPQSESPTIENIYYDKSIFLNFQTLIIFEIGILIITTILTLLLYFQNNPKETIIFGFNEKDSEIQFDKKHKKKNKEVKISKKTEIKKAIYNKRAIRLFIMIFSFFPSINCIYNTWRPIGIYYKINTYYLQLTTALFSIIGCLSSIIFALIGDKIKFRSLFLLFSFSLIIVSLTFPLSFKNDFYFISEVLIMAFILRGYNIIIDPHIIKVYGIRNYIEIGGIIRSSGGLCEILSVVFAFYLENNFLGDKNYIYKLMYIITAFFNLISLILGLFEGNDKFKYEN